MEYKLKTSAQVIAQLVECLPSTQEAPELKPKNHISQEW